ncbi:DUF6319 family protein [Rhodococcus chondri]|uniref:DUF6319 family protein n=1 Tax=Rhodococcus chondri TaxID=3065941 RepID=A0ABU7JQP0_9NOCA|nr:DUF6319 family protein [Rhodococcus sp. CC-R104]MEE2032336.1 DUF6319 family protein [Rhodococcus sp. CC-R104]
MPPRRRADHLTDEQLSTLATAIADGRRATVYLVDGIPSLGIEPGTSARAIAVSGSTVTVRPKGVDDELPFEADELRLTRETSSKTAPGKRAGTQPAAPKSAAPKPAAPKPAAPKPAVPTPAPARPSKETVPVTQTPASAAATTEPAKTAEAAKPKTPARRGAKKQAAITITVTIDPENEWTVGVAHGARKVAKPATVAPDAVERAVRELGDETALEAVQSVIDAARQAAEERVAQLSRELEAARKALESLGATPQQD